MTPPVDRERSTASQVYPQAPRELDTRHLFDGARELVIRHGAETYTLRLTRAGKLLLTK